MYALGRLAVASVLVRGGLIPSLCTSFEWFAQQPSREFVNNI